MRNPALRYHGGKFRLAPWILGYFPPHKCYVEPFGGAAGVLLQKPRCYAEIYNDLDGDIVNFFRVLRDPVQSARLVELCTMTPFSRDDFDQAYEPTDDPVVQAQRIAIRAAMGFGSAGASKHVTGFRTDTRRKYGTAQHVWAKYPDTISFIGQRMAGVLIENRPAIEVMRQHDALDTLHYCDPPYVFSTRDPRAQTESGSRYYRHEMTDEDHTALLTALRDLEGMVIVSGYPSALYDGLLAGWERHDTTSRISGGRGAEIRTEVLWMNHAASAALRRPRAQGELSANF